MVKSQRFLLLLAMLFLLVGCGGSTGSTLLTSNPGTPVAAITPLPAQPTRRQPALPDGTVLPGRYLSPVSGLTGTATITPAAATVPPAGTPAPAATATGTLSTAMEGYTPITSTTGVLVAEAFGTEVETGTLRIIQPRIPAIFGPAEAVSGTIACSVALAAGTQKGTHIRFVWLSEQVAGLPTPATLATTQDSVLAEEVHIRVFVTSLLRSQGPLPAGSYRVEVSVDGRLEYSGSFTIGSH